MLFLCRLQMHPGIRKKRWSFCRQILLFFEGSLCVHLCAQERETKADRGEEGQWGDLRRMLEPAAKWFCTEHLVLTLGWQAGLYGPLGVETNINPSLVGLLTVLVRDRWLILPNISDPSVCQKLKNWRPNKCRISFSNHLIEKRVSLLVTGMTSRAIF